MKKALKIAYTFVTVLVLGLLVFLVCEDNTVVKNKREPNEYALIEDVTRTEEGSKVVFSFLVDDILEYDTNIMFYISHHWVEVWVGEENIYQLVPSGSISFIKTPGAKWVCIPVYHKDLGKEVRIELTPAYENHVKETLDVYYGSIYAVYRNQFRLTFPANVLSLANIIVGVVFLIIVICFRKEEKKESELLLSLGVLGVSVGLWQLTHNDFSAFFLEGKAVFLYYVSVTMLLVFMIPLVRAVSTRLRKECDRVMQYYLLVVSVMVSVQIVLQILGVFDLREMFSFTHGSIIIGAVLLIISMVVTGRKEGNLLGDNNGWILIVGVLGDLGLYIWRGSSSGLLLILTSVLMYMLFEGVRFLTVYFNQKRLLDEKENQLIQSQVTTMMSQIRSHFVFNVLNAISGMCKYDPEKADESIVRFARYLRNNVDIIEADGMIPFEMELQRLEDYVLLEQIRFGNKIEFVTDIEVSDFMIPPLVLQPIVENAIRHGVTKRPLGGTIMVSTWKENQRIFICVDDDGVGFDMEELKKEKSTGIKNIRFRMQYLLNGTIDFKSEKEKGTKVTISFPEEQEE